MKTSGSEQKPTRGFVLPLSLMVSIIILSTLAIWYRQVLVQGYLAQALLTKVARYQECQSMLPLLIQQLDEVAVDSLEVPQDHFLEMKTTGLRSWTVSRSAWDQQKVRFEFKLSGDSVEPLALTIGYTRPP